jgi:type IV secretion system protein VirD4
MAELAGDTLTTQILADVIISNTAKSKTDHFWDNGEGNLLKSLILYIDQDNSRPPEAKHLPAVYQFLTQTSERQLSSLFARLPVTHPARAPYNLFAQASDTVRAGIVLGLGTRLQILQNEAIRRITSGNDIDLAEPGKAKCAYFVILSDQESSTEFLSSLYFSFLFIRLIRYADAMPEKRCKVPVNIIFEEFNNVGSLDSYPRRLSVARSRSLQICHIVQSLAQFQNRYPNNEWAEIIGSCDTQLMLGINEQEGAEFFSLRSGDSTVQVNSTMTVKKTIAIAQMIPQYRETDGLGRRRLLTPDELFRFPNDELLIVIRGENCLRARKFDYTGHPYAKLMKPSSIFDYNPRQENSPLPRTENENPNKPQTDKKNSGFPLTGSEDNDSYQSGSEDNGSPQTVSENYSSTQTDIKKPPTKLFAAAKPPDEF